MKELLDDILALLEKLLVFVRRRLIMWHYGRPADPKRTKDRPFHGPVPGIKYIDWLRDKIDHIRHKDWYAFLDWVAEDRDRVVAFYNGEYSQ